MLLPRKRGVIFGIRSPRSLGWAIARAASEHGATLCLSYRGEAERSRAEQLAADTGSLAIPCDVTSDDQIVALYARLAAEWGSLDFIVHSVAFAPPGELEGGVLGTSREGFSVMSEVSAYSLPAVTRPALPLMTGGGSLLALTYDAVRRVVPLYGPMAVAKAELDCLVRYLAVELGPRGIRCNALSSGPVETVSARMIPGFTALLRQVPQTAPLRRNVEMREVADGAVFLLSDMAAAITGQTLYVDCGQHLV